MGAAEETVCVVCVSVTEGGEHSGDRCNVLSTLCEYDLRKGDLFVLLGKDATSETGMYLFRAANVWWRYAQYFVIASCG